MNLFAQVVFIVQVHDVQVEHAAVAGHVQAKGARGQGNHVGQDGDGTIGLGPQGHRHHRRAHVVGGGEHVVGHPQVGDQQVAQKVGQQHQDPGHFLAVAGEVGHIAQGEAENQVAQTKPYQQVGAAEVAGDGGPDQGQNQVPAQRAHGAPPSTAVM